MVANGVPPVVSSVAKATGRVVVSMFDLCVLANRPSDMDAQQYFLSQ